VPKDLQRLGNFYSYEGRTFPSHRAGWVWCEAKRGDDIGMSSASLFDPHKLIFMTIPPISSNDPYALTPFQQWLLQQKQDMQSLGNALQSGDISASQKAFATLQQDVQNINQTKKQPDPTDPKSVIAADFQTLSKALQSGDIKSAQDAFAKLQEDMKGLKSHRGHHKHGAKTNDADAQASNSSPIDNSSSVQDSGSGNIIDTQA